MRPICSIFWLTVAIPVSVLSQSTGINTPKPNTKAALHVKAKGKQGVLLPSLAATDTSSFAATLNDKGLTFYDSVNARYLYWTGVKWNSFPSISSSSVTGIGSTNQLTYWSSPYTLGNSNLTMSAGKIGMNIDPSSASYNLQINEPLGLSSSIQLTAGLATGTGAGRGLVLQTGLLAANILNYSSTSLNFGTAGATIFSLTAAGNIQAPYLAGPGMVTTDALGNFGVVAGIAPTGTGTLNKVAVWTAANKLGASQITDDGNYVYIGNVGAAPRADLYISRPNPVGIKLNNTSASTAVVLRTGYNGALSHLLEYSHDLVLSAVSYANVGIGSGPSNYVRFTDIGNVGLGVDPVARLHIRSAANLNTIFESSSTIGTWIDINNSGGGEWFSTIATGNGNGEGAGKLMFCKNSAAGAVIGHFMTLDHATGNVGLGEMTDPAYTLHVNGTAAKTSGAAWIVASDMRLKENIAPFKDGLSTLVGIEPVSFNYNGKGGLAKGSKQYGVLAQEIQKVAPYTVSNSYKAKLNPKDDKETDLLTFDSGPLLFVLINSVKELNSKLDTMQSDLQRLKIENADLKEILWKQLDKGTATAPFYVESDKAE